MATATRKKAGKASTRRSSRKKAAAKKPAPRKKSSAKKKATPVQEPERSAPAMAEVDADVLEFIAAIDQFKQQHGRPFPSWSEVLLIVRQLGYRRD
ncbi:MAG TPA: hypothetical protein ENI87_15395 [bacterium]|nr:hypothetical protein [bacterium]